MYPGKWWTGIYRTPEANPILLASLQSDIPRTEASHHFSPAGVSLKPRTNCWYDHPKANIPEAPANWDPRK
jgi:hypothetical protein